MNESTESEACLVAAQLCHLVSCLKFNIQICLKCYITDIELLCVIFCHLKVTMRQTI